MYTAHDVHDTCTQDMYIIIVQQIKVISDNKNYTGIRVCASIPVPRSSMTCGRISNFTKRVTQYST